MITKKTFIPAKPRNKKLINSGGGSYSAAASNNNTTGGALTSEQLEIINNLSNWWKVDEQGNLYSDKNVYSKLNISAFGMSEGGSGGGGGESISMMQGWTLTTATENYYLPAQLAVPFYNDTRGRLTVLEAGTAPLAHIHTIADVTGLQTALNLKANLASPTFSGTVTAPTFSGTLSGNANTATTASNLSVSPTEGTLGITTYSLGGYGFRWSYGGAIEAIKTGVGFGWHNTEWVVGNLRDGGTGSYGFGIGYKNAAGNLDGHFRIAVGGTAYLNNIAVATVNSNVASATTLQTARTIAGVSFNGSANIAIPFANLSGIPTTLSGYGITDAYTKTEVNSALISKLDKSVFEDLFEKVEISAGVFAIKAKYNFFGVGNISAYGFDSSGGGGGESYNRLDTWASYDGTKAGWVLSALLGKELDTRVINLESGSALTVNTTGAGNAITSISKAGSVVTANKGLTFLETSIFNTHNTDNIRHITGAERTKWDGVVTDFGNLQIGGRNLFSILNTQIGQSGLLAYSKQVEINGFYGVGDNNNYANYVRLDNVIKGNGFYTVSFEMRGTQSAQVGLYVSIAGVKSEMFLTNNLNTYNGRKYYAVEVTDYTINSRVEFHLQFAYFYIKDIKLEKGNKPTDWSPAPEDQVSDWLTTDVNSLSFIKNKPTTLAGYGITDAVTLNTAQTITGAKTFNNNVNILGNTTTNRIVLSSVAAEAQLEFSRPSYNYINTPLNGGLSFVTNGDSIGVLNSMLVLSPNGNVGVGKGFTNNTTAITAQLHVRGDILATGTTTTAKVIFAAAGWSMEQVGSELQLKHNGTLKQRFLNDGTIVAMGNITAFN